MHPTLKIPHHHQRWCLRPKPFYITYPSYTKFSYTTLFSKRFYKVCKVTTIQSRGLKMGGFFLVVEYARGGSVTNRATPSSFYFYYDTSIIGCREILSLQDAILLQEGCIVLDHLIANLQIFPDFQAHQKKNLDGSIFEWLWSSSLWSFVRGD